MDFESVLRSSWNGSRIAVSGKFIGRQLLYPIIIHQHPFVERDADNVNENICVHSQAHCE